MKRRREEVVPTVVECPGCGKMRKTVRGTFTVHSVYPTGPRCLGSQQLITPADIEATRNVARMNKVLLWAQMLRDEDPSHVASWIATEEPRELALLLATALAAIPPQSVESAYGWVRELA